MSTRSEDILNWTRRVLLGVFLLAFVYLTWDRTICEDELASTGGQGAVRICRSITITDPPVLGGMVLVLLLLLPDISEIGIPGFLSLKRRVQEQESQLVEHEGRLTMLHTQIDQAIGLQQTATQDVATQAHATSVNVLDIAGVLQNFEISGPWVLRYHPARADIRLAKRSV